MILLLILPVLSYLTLHWLTDKYLLNHRWLSGSALIISNLCGIGLFIIFCLINEVGYVRTISSTWLTIANHSFLISLTFNNFSAWILALWATGSLILITIISTSDFDPRTYRENMFNLSISVFAVNGLLLANDFLLILWFWATLSLSVYRILFRIAYNSSNHHLSNGLIFTSFLILVLAVVLLFSITGSFQIDTIVAQLASGAIVSRQMIWPAIMIILAVVLMISQLVLHQKPDNRVIIQPSDEFIMFCGLMPSGLFLLIKLLPILPVICTHALTIMGGLSALIALIIHLTKSDFSQFIRLNTVVQISLILIAIGVGYVSVSIFLLISLFIINILSIILIRDFKSVVEPDGFSITLPIRVIVWFNLIGLPLTLVFNARLQILQAIFSNPGLNPIMTMIAIGLLGAIFFLNSAVMFRIFFMTNAYKPVRRKNSPVVPLMHWIAAGVAIASLYIFYTFPILNPLITKFNDLLLYRIYPVDNSLQDYSLIRLKSLIIYTSTIGIGLVFGFILTKYIKVDKLALRLNNWNKSLQNHLLQPIANLTHNTARKAVRFDTVLMPTGEARTWKFLQRIVAYFSCLNDHCSRQLAGLEGISIKLTNKLLEKSQQIKFVNIIGIVLLILLIIILICIL